MPQNLHTNNRMSLTTSQPNQSISTEPLEIWNCFNCRRRKVRCDRRFPCAPCIRKHVHCIFPHSGRLPSRNRIPENAKTTSHTRVELLTRLRRLEAMVGDLGSQVEGASLNNPAKSPEMLGRRSDQDSSSANCELPDSDIRIHTDSALNSNPERPEDFAVDSRASTQYISENDNGELVVGDPFWSIFCKEVEHIFEAVHGPSAVDLHKHMMTDIGPDHQLNYYGFLQRRTSLTSDNNAFRPLPSQMLFLWQVYTENVDPFIKVLHKPTMAITMRSLNGDFKSLEPSLQALLLVIAFTAAITLDDAEIESNFNVSKAQLLSGFRLAADSAIADADIVARPDLVLLQAYAIYLGVLQHESPSVSTWRVNGVLIRAAVSLGLHRNTVAKPGSYFFDAELNRRLWWQICLLDTNPDIVGVRAFSISENMFDTYLPTNLDDQQLQRSTKFPPVAVEAYTDTSIFLLRCQIWKFCQALTRYMAESQNIILIHFFEQFREEVQTSCLNHLNANQDLHRFVLATTRLFLNRIELVLHTRFYATSSETISLDVLTKESSENRIFRTCVAIVQDVYDLQHESNWRGWRWQIRGRHPPWRCLQQVLSWLQRSQDTSNHISSADFDRALVLVRKSLGATPEGFRGKAKFRQLSSLLMTIEAHQPGNTADPQISEDPFPVASESDSLLDAQDDLNVIKWSPELNTFADNDYDIDIGPNIAFDNEIWNIDTDPSTSEATWGILDFINLGNSDQLQT